jgi:hypothetical protein
MHTRHQVGRPHDINVLIASPRSSDVAITVQHPILMGL